MDCNSARTSASISVPAGANRSLISVSVDSAILKCPSDSSVVVIDSVKFCLEGRLGERVETRQRVKRSTKKVGHLSHLGIYTSSLSASSHRFHIQITSRAISWYVLEALEL